MQRKYPIRGDCESFFAKWGIFFLTLPRRGVIKGHSMNAPLILPITLSDLKPETRDWLLAKSARLGVSPITALNTVLQEIAIRELGKGKNGEGRAA
jgi:hypothetical protein